MEVITYYNKEKFSCNTYILKTNETNIIVDPNDDSNNILDFLENNKIKIDYILITHAHFDHIRGLFNIYHAVTQPADHPSDNGHPTPTANRPACA